MYLKEPCIEDAEKLYAFISEMPLDENGFTNPRYGASFEVLKGRFLPMMRDYALGKNLPDGFVPETFLFLWHEGEIVGEFRIRHYLTEALRNGAGHIGYFIKKEHRGKGFGTSGLSLTLEKARAIIPEDEIYLRVNRDNAPSLRVILKNGGYVHHEDDEKYYLRIKK